MLFVFAEGVSLAKTNKMLNTNQKLLLLLEKLKIVLDTSNACEN